MSTARIWRLTIMNTEGRSLEVHGTEDNLRPEIDAWVAHQTKHAKLAQQAHESKSHDGHYEWESEIPRLIHGFTDTGDRTQTVIAYMFGDVESMSLVEI